MILLQYTIGGVFVYVMQLVNAYTQDVIRQTEYDNPEVILSILENENNPNRKGIETFIFDSQKRTLTATYVTHTVTNDGDNIIYRLFYKVKMADVQAVVK